ncbi:MAG: hypothetical protein A2284_04180 [Deltaproteobacteria bacterium RIFOXYA12_FULL_61_11]|nr:MAG: hypothetical protein A2284_04180 [Deltaproteobacteria bacterium RIFOXYA12_FULL_61_11]
MTEATPTPPVGGRIVQRLSKAVDHRRHRLDRWLFAAPLCWWTIRPWMLTSSGHRLATRLRLQEAEHQFGRLLHLRSIFEDIAKHRLPGDFVEFGTYQGFSLAWLHLFRTSVGLGSRRLIGVDSFKGLPTSSTVWHQGQFSDSSVSTVCANLLRYHHLRDLSAVNLHLIEGLFEAPEVRAQLTALTSNIVLAHLDCDLGSSCDAALDLLDRATLAPTAYLAFDDWGCHVDEIPASFERYQARHPELSFEVQATTTYTRYFRCTRIR